MVVQLCLPEKVLPIEFCVKISIACSSQKSANHPASPVLIAFPLDMESAEGSLCSTSKILSLLLHLYFHCPLSSGFCDCFSSSHSPPPQSCLMLSQSNNNNLTAYIK